ncbi:MAG: heparinase II/III family protein [Clostridia bacterium]|nr:heparinase II/III family protein [Clostridia bacterium]
MKKLLLVLIAVLAFSVCLVTSCGKKPVDPTPDDPTPDDPIVVEQDVEIKDGDGYVIVYGSRNFDATLANSLRGTLKTLGINDVTIAKASETAETAKEILVGDTGRTASDTLVAKATAKVASGDSAYFVEVHNGKLCIYCSDSSMNAPAIEKISSFVSNGVLSVNRNSMNEFIYTAAEKKADEDAAAAAAAEKAKKEREEELAALKVTHDAFKSSEFGTATKLNSPYSAPSITPAANSHPRVLLSADKVAQLKLVNTSSAQDGTAYEKYIALSNEKTDGKLNPTTATMHYNYNSDVLNIIEAYALRYVIEGDELYGLRAVVAMRNFLSTLVIEDSSSNGGRDTSGYMNDSYRAWGYTMYTAAEVYDWCYNVMTADDRTAFIAAIKKKVGPSMEIGYPPAGQGAVAGHGCESQLLRDWLAFAIATYDESPDIYNYVMGRIESEYVDVREFIYQSGMHMQGNDYGTYRFNFDLIAEYLVETACGERLFNVDLGEVARSFIYNVRPDNTLLRVGDITLARFGTFNMSSYAKTMFYSAAVNSDPIAKGEAKKFLDNFNRFYGSDQTLTPSQFLVFNDTSVEIGSREDLPLAVYNGTPVGQIIARDSWGSDAAMLYMKIGEYFSANHEHKDVGSFQIFYGKALAIDSGYYDKYGTTVHYSYTMSTLAHNSLLIYQPNESTGSYLNVGGQKSSSSESSTLSNWLGKDYTKRASVLGHKIIEKDGKPVYAYISGDLTAAYVSSKVDEVLRFMVGVYTNDPNVPIIFFVFDKITADDGSYKKTFLLHTLTEPTVTGNVTAVINGDGALINRTLLPGTGNVDIKVVEGPYTGVAAEDVVTRFDATYAAAERGWGRVEISPKVGNKTDYLLNVMYVTKSGNTLATNYAEAVSYENDSVAGASVLNVAAFFAKEAEGLSKRFEIEGNGTGTVKYSVAGVKEGTWTVYGADNNAVAVIEVDEESGFLTFEAAPGTYKILPEGDSIDTNMGDGYVVDPFPPLG